MPITTHEEGNTVTILLDDKFVFSDHRAFRGTYQDRPSATHYIVDFRRVSYMDSSALGMLLLLKEEGAGGDRTRVKLLHCNEQVKKILEVANFSQLFILE
ncbi:STAS-domain containing protein [Candidatus Magnetaquicoccaceae bacterium FCR-1]|uniref:STAS-domain containing protein n=1 Tax=Candidatus Magnetaquiglobus chichijimensis TaxID=3141448 RepID=A0ABQ0CA65_9PROT